MRRIKYAAVVVLTVLGIIFTSELFQNHVETFTSGLFFSRITDIAGDDIYAQTDMAASGSGAAAFAIRRVTDSFDDLQCTVYANDEAAEILKRRYGITRGSFKSLISGITEITVESFAGYAGLSGIAEQRIYFIGDRSQITETVNAINVEQSCLSVPVKERSTHSWLVYAIWGVILLFLLLLTWFSLQFDRKKDFIRISMGVSRSRIIINGAAVDAAVFAFTFAAANIIFSRFIYTGYAFWGIVFESIVYIILNSILHLSLLRYDYKAIVYGANLNKRLLANCYALKALVMIITITSVSLNAVWIKDNARYLRMYRYIYEFGDYYRLDYEFPEGLSYEESRILSKSLPGELLMDGYCGGKVALASMIAGVGDLQNDQSLFIYNRNSRNLLTTKEIQDVLDSGYDFCLFIPERLEDTSAATQAVEGFTELMYYTFDIKEDSYSWKTHYYRQDIELLYFEFDNLSITEYGFEIAEDPMFIYCAASPEKMREMIIGDGIPYTAIGMEVLFSINDEELEEMEGLYGVKSFEKTSVVELCERHKAVFIRIVLLNSLLSVFMLILAISIMVSAIRLEYRVNAKLLAIRKILGHSVIKKNLFMIILNALTVVIGTAASLFLSVTAGGFEAAMPCCVGLALIIIETLIMIINIEYLEKTNTAKILKGGSL